MHAVVARWLETHKPVARRRTQLLMAELMWTLVGAGLLALGLRWVLQRYGARGLLYAVPFLALGLAKALLALDRTAGRTVGRIVARGELRCALGFLSTGGWILVACMMVAGRLLRASPLPRADIGFLYVAVGSGLLVASRTLWRRWWAERAAPLPLSGS